MSSSQSQYMAIITGASSGIGKATALAFARSGIALALVGRSQSQLAQVAREVADIVEVKVYSLDLAQLEEIKPKFAQIDAEFGPSDILANIAGMGYTNPLSDTSLADWQQVIAINLTSVLQCIQGVLPGMRDRARGTIINVASIAAHHPFPGWGAYNVSKAGLIALSKTLAAEEKANGIRVMTISPGAVNTPLWDTQTVDADLDRSAMLTPQIVAQSILQAALLPKQATIEEVTLMPSAGAL